MKKELPANLDEWWPCACSRRKKNGTLQIKLHSPKVGKCKTCGCVPLKQKDLK